MRSANSKLHTALIASFGTLSLIIVSPSYARADASREPLVDIAQEMLGTLVAQERQVLDSQIYDFSQMQDEGDESGQIQDDSDESGQMQDDSDEIGQMQDDESGQLQDEDEDESDESGQLQDESDESSQLQDDTDEFGQGQKVPGKHPKQRKHPKKSGGKVGKGQESQGLFGQGRESDVEYGQGREVEEEFGLGQKTSGKHPKQRKHPKKSGGDFGQGQKSLID